MMWWVATSGYAEVWLSSLALGTGLASGLSRVRPKYVFVWYRDLVYVITTKSVRDGGPAKHARNWVSCSNANTNSLWTWEGLRAVWQRKAVATAMTATAWQPVTNDSVRTRMVKIRFRYRAGKLKKIKLLRLNWLALNMLPPTNIKLSPPTFKTHQVRLNKLLLTIKCWQHKAARRRDPPQNMSATVPGECFLRTKHHTGWKWNHWACEQRQNQQTMHQHW
jgi:hypothetical protein